MVPPNLYIPFIRSDIAIWPTDLLWALETVPRDSPPRSETLERRFRDNWDY